MYSVGEEVGIDEDAVGRLEGGVVVEEHARGHLGSEIESVSASRNEDLE